MLLLPVSMDDNLEPGGGEHATSRWDKAKETVKKILTTLDNFNDNVNVVVFNSEAWSLQGDTLIEASQENIDALSASLDNISLAVGADNNKAFNKAFDLFEATFRQRKGASICQNVGTGGILPEFALVATFSTLFVSIF